MQGFLTICGKGFLLLFPVALATFLAYWFNLCLFNRQKTHNKKVRQQELFLNHVSKAEENIVKYWEQDASNQKLGQSVVKNIEFLFKLTSLHGDKILSDNTKCKLEDLILELHCVATGGSFQSGNKASPDTISKSLGITGEMKIFLFD
jgi:hypothetical protein